MTLVTLLVCRRELTFLPREMGLSFSVLSDEGKREDLPAPEPEDIPPAPPSFSRNKGANKAGRQIKKRGKLAHQDSQSVCYYIDADGRRRVKPYVHIFETHTKRRWEGRTVLEVFTKEFPLGEAYYKASILDGRIMVNSRPIALDHVLCGSHIVSNLTHRHELPTSGVDAEIIEETDELLVVDKPASLPVHPCGAYRFNSLHYLMARTRPNDQLLIVHRLDRLTSGLVTFAKNKAIAHMLSEAIQTGKALKTYLARVRGDFGSCFPEEFEWHGGDQPRPQIYWEGLQDQQMQVCAPIGAVSIKDGKYGVMASGKEAATTFCKLWYDAGSDSSLVECQPRNGRTHQLRVHLQWLGHPICNDTCYGGELHYADPGAASEAEEAQAWLKAHELRKPAAKEPQVQPRHPSEDDASYIERTCDICSDEEAEKVMRMEARLRPLCIWLHALRYDFGSSDVAFETQWPTWAKQPAAETVENEQDAAMDTWSSPSCVPSPASLELPGAKRLKS
jgi:23S rRNA-/tRNA-specific pseudouridylate synthase